MNANELAEITYPHRVRGLTDEEIDLLIRQQQTEIEALKAEVKQWEEWKESLNGWSKK